MTYALSSSGQLMLSIWEAEMIRFAKLKGDKGRTGCNSGSAQNGGLQMGM